MLKFLSQTMQDLQANSLYRTLKTIDELHGIKALINGKEYLLFCSNDYLGLSQHPTVISRAQAALQTFGAGAGAARLISGNTVLHDQLEQKLARFKKRASALVFPTGYMANLGTISAITNEQDTIIIDRLNHASIVDACKLSKAKLQVYPHKDMATLERILQRTQKYTKRLVITDAVFSMDGDIAPLPEIIALAKKYNAITMVDEAHSTGVLGKTGRGIEEHFGIEGQIDIVMGTLSKALGSLGGFIAGSADLIAYLKNKARSFIYTTALPPANCAAALAALEIIESEPQHLVNLRNNQGYLMGQLKTLPLNTHLSETPIIPIMFGDEKQAIKAAEQLFEKGILLFAIRYPTVARGSARLRLTLSATHSKEDMDKLLAALHPHTNFTN